MTERMTASEYRNRHRKGKAEKPKDARHWQQRFDSKAEEAFAKEGWRDFAAAFCWASDTAWPNCRLEFHSVTLRLAGQTYTPDFTFIVFGSEVRHYVEVKRGYRRDYHNYRDSRSKLRAAAATYSHDKFYVAWYEKDNNLRFEEIK